MLFTVETLPSLAQCTPMGPEKVEIEVIDPGLLSIWNVNDTLDGPDHSNITDTLLLNNSMIHLN